MPLKKIAILGGGVGSLTTALSLTSEPDWKSKYDITVYQLGWRLGGKGASGRKGRIVRGPDGRATIEGSARIQEHGLHIWLGFYENAFRIIQQVYAENEPNLPPDAPLRLWSDAFKKHSFICLEESPGKANWSSWPVNFPEDDKVPGDGSSPCTIWDYIKMLLDHLHDYFKDSSFSMENVDPATHQAVAATLHPFGAEMGELWIDTEAVATACATEVVQSVCRLAHSFHPIALFHEARQHDALLAALNSFHAWLVEHMKHRVPQAARTISVQAGAAVAEAPAATASAGALDFHDRARRDFMIMDLGIAILRGLITERVWFDPNEFDVLEEEFQGWLCKHGADDSSCKVSQSAIMRGLYDLVFAYIDGDTSQASFATGPALRSVFDMLLHYKGAIFWKMQAGMGDTIFSPIYMVLKQRGVKFEFFHAVENLGLSADKSAVETIRIGRQVHLKDLAREYDPLVWVKGVPCWPATADYSQIVEGDQLQAQNINLESFWTPWKSVETLTLRAGVDFDEVVLGISLGALPFLCPELIAAAPSTWGRMCQQVKTVRTMGFQFWVNQDLKELGWFDESPVMDAYVEPLNTWADMSQLLVREQWTQLEKPPKSCAYFCGQMIEAVLPADADQFVRSTAAEFATGPLLKLWPGLHNEPPQHFLQHAPGADDQGALEAQYYRANVDPSERYVMSVAGATSARLRADQSGFRRLTLTGDWISNGFNAGCVEASVWSGLQAANVLLGRPLAYGISTLRQNFGQEKAAN